MQEKSMKSWQAYLDGNAVTALKIVGVHMENNDALNDKNRLETKIQLTGYN